MDASVKKSQLIEQLMNYFEQDKSRLLRLGDGLRLLGLDTNDAHLLDKIAERPEVFATLISYSDLGLLSKLKEVVDILKEK